MKTSAHQKVKLWKAARLNILSKSSVLCVLHNRGATLMSWPHTATAGQLTIWLLFLFTALHRVFGGWETLNVSQWDPDSSCSPPTPSNPAQITQRRSTQILTSVFSLPLHSTAVFRSHHDSTYENDNHHNNNHGALGCGQQYHHNRVQGAQQGSAQATSCNPTDSFPSAPGVLPFTWTLLQGNWEKRHNVASDPEGHACWATLSQGNTR